VKFLEQTLVTIVAAPVDALMRNPIDAVTHFDPHFHSTRNFTAFLLLHDLLLVKVLKHEKWK
jgi:hypothetical protein